MHFHVCLLSLTLHASLATAAAMPYGHAVAHESIHQRLVHHAHSFIKSATTSEAFKATGSITNHAYGTKDDGKTGGHQLVGLISTLTEEFRDLDFGAMFWSSANGIVSLELSCVPSFPTAVGRTSW